mgnify:CR=1 FL=1
MQQLARGAARVVNQQLRMACNMALRPATTAVAATGVQRLAQPLQLAPTAAGLARLRSGASLLPARLQRVLCVSARAQAGEPATQAAPTATAAAAQQEPAGGAPKPEFVVVNFYQ